MAASGDGDEDGGEDEDDEWRFSLSDLEDDGDAGEAGDVGDDETGGEGVAGSFSPSETIEAGEIDLENALFVLLGVAIGLVIVGTYTLALF